MILHLRRSKRGAKKTEKFLYLPTIYRGRMYWLEKVRIKRNYNGSSFQITDISPIQ